MSQPHINKKNVKIFPININKTRSNKQPNNIPEDDQRNGQKCLGLYEALSSPPWPKHKKNNKTWMSSLEDLEKKTNCSL